MIYFLYGTLIALSWLVAGLVVYCMIILDAKKMVVATKVVELVSYKTILKVLLRWPIILFIWATLPPEE